MDTRRLLSVRNAFVFCVACVMFLVYTKYSKNIRIKEEKYYLHNYINNDGNDLNVFQKQSQNHLPLVQTKPEKEFGVDRRFNTYHVTSADDEQENHNKEYDVSKSWYPGMSQMANKTTLNDGEDQVEEPEIQLELDDGRESIQGVKKKNVSLSSLAPKGGNTLPNYFLHGINRGLTPDDYRNGIVVFLHHNKAAGSTVAQCLKSMSRRGIYKHHSSLYISSNVISTQSIEQITRHSLFPGGYTFWICAQFQGRNCSYFTVMRNPYDRILSSYFYCKVNQTDQLCGPLTVFNFTISQWAIYQGSYFFNQLLMNPKFCKQNNEIQSIFEKYYSHEIPTNTSRYISYEGTSQCWFKQKVFLNAILNTTGKDVLLQHVLAKLDSWFSVIGLTEEFDLSLRMFSVTYDLPFFKLCRGDVINKTPSDGDESNLRERMKRELMLDPKVTDALRSDLRIYERILQIFQQQKQRLDELMK